MAKLADALDSGSSPRKGVEVRVLSSAPRNQMIYEPPAAKAAFSSLLLRLFGCHRGILHVILRHRSGIQDAGYWRVEQMFRRQTSPNYLGAQFLSRTQVSCRRYLADGAHAEGGGVAPGARSIHSADRCRAGACRYGAPFARNPRGVGCIAQEEMSSAEK